MNRTRFHSIGATLLVVACGSASQPSTAPPAAPLTILSVDDVAWEQLNPARGDQSPQAGTLWGDRKGEVPTGFLAKFVDGFSSPPHIHNATYRAVVIEGLVHNDDPEAEPMWMPVGSFWKQPEGEVHITSAKGPTNIALVEIDRGPYLVKPPEEAFDSGRRPMNVHADNLVWVDPPDMRPSKDGPKVSYLWGALDGNATHGTFIKLPAGFVGTLQSHGPLIRVVVIRGTPTLRGDVLRPLKPGSYVGASGPTEVPLAAKGEAVLYVRSDGRYTLSTHATSGH